MKHMKDEGLKTQGETNKQMKLDNLMNLSMNHKHQKAQDRDTLFHVSGL